MVIWTTTPWTIPANLALCVNQDLEYVAVRMEAGAGGASRHVIVATEQLAEFAAALGQPVDALHVVHRLHVRTRYCRCCCCRRAFTRASSQGRDLVGAVCAHPLARRTSPVLHG
ncbi:hypothetical protein, partial [Brevundimonas sp.]|uniref:hypothetical protein n=1 Tax=Brevundimonas sp. TaxID=1871086 RepID=UPI00391A1CE3